MREVAAGYLSVVVVQATGKRCAGVAGMKPGLFNVVCTKPSVLLFVLLVLSRPALPELWDQLFSSPEEFNR